MRSKTCSQRQSTRVGWSQLGAILLLTLFGVVPASAQGQNAVVRSDPSVLEIGPGQVATLTIVLADAQNAYGIDVRAAFDPQLVEAVDADPAKDGIQMMPGTFPQPDFVARNVADNQAGSLRYAVTQVNPTEPVTGSGVIFSVQFRAKASSGQSTFTIATVEMTDRSGVLLPVQTESGTIRIVPVEQTQPSQPATTVASVGDSTATAVAASAGSTQLTEEPLPQATVAPTPAANQAAVPEPENKAGSEMPTAVVLALVAIIAVVIVVIARRRDAK